MMNPFLNGFSVLFSNLLPVTCLLLTSCGAGVWIAHVFTRSHSHARLLTLSLSPALGLIPLALSFYLFSLLSRVWQPAAFIGSLIACLLSILSLVWWFIRNRSPIPHRRTVLLIAAGSLSFLLLLILRLSYLHELLLPPYTDSPFHFRIVLDLLASPNPQIGHLPGSFYHTAFHALTAWLSSLTALDPLRAMPLVGQLLLAITPLGVYALALVFTSSRRAARMSALLAAFAWSMPSFAANWGKYPAIAAISILPALAALGLLAFQIRKKRVLKMILFLVLLAGGVLFHSRMLVCAVIFGVTVLITLTLARPVSQIRSRWLAILVLLICAFLFARSRELSALYGGHLYIAVAVLLILLVFATIYRSQKVLTLGVLILLVFVALNLPVPHFLHFPASTLLDREFIAMCLFLPLSILGGLGFDALYQHHLQNRILQFTATGLLILAVGFCAVFTPVYAPDPCCNLVTKDDLTTLDWMESHLPDHALVYAPSMPTIDGSAGADAGIWITPLTGLPTKSLPYDISWFSMDVYQQVCHSSPAYLYVSGQVYRFQIDAVTRPEWYWPVFSRGEVTLFKIISCSDNL